MFKKFQKPPTPRSSQTWQQDPSWLLKNLLRMTEEAGLLENEGIQRAIFAAGMANDFHTLTALQQIMRPHYLRAQIEKNPFRPAPRDNEVDGEIRIGTVVETGAPYGLSLKQDLPRHVGIYGGSGTGKTQLIYLMMFWLVQLGTPFTVFDFKKDYGYFAEALREYFEIVVIWWRYFKENPNKPPPNTPPGDWLQYSADIFAPIVHVMFGSKAFVMKVIDLAYQGAGVYEGADGYPSMYEVFEILKKMQIPKIERDARFLETALGRIEALLTVMGEVLDCSSGMPLEELTDMNWILQLDGLAMFAQSFIVTTILYWIFVYRLNQEQRGGLGQVVILDEAMHVLNKDPHTAGEPPMIDQFLSKVRDTSVGVIFGTQQPSRLTSSAHANSATKIAFALRDGQDIFYIARSMSLNREQMEWFNRLPTGYAIVRTHRYPHPFVIKIPYLPVRETAWRKR